MWDGLCAQCCQYLPPHVHLWSTSFAPPPCVAGGWSNTTHSSLSDRDRAYYKLLNIRIVGSLDPFLRNLTLAKLLTNHHDETESSECQLVLINTWLGIAVSRCVWLRLWKLKGKSTLCARPGPRLQSTLHITPINSVIAALWLLLTFVESWDCY